MLIIGCDFHSRFQQIAMPDPQTGEVIERRLEHENGEARRFYAGLGTPARVGMEATGYARLFARMVAEQGHQLWVGDAARRWCASRRRTRVMLAIFSTCCAETSFRGSGFRPRRSATCDNCCGTAINWSACALP